MESGGTPNLLSFQQDGVHVGVSDAAAGVEYVLEFLGGDERGLEVGLLDEAQGVVLRVVVDGNLDLPGIGWGLPGIVSGEDGGLEAVGEIEGGVDGGVDVVVPGEREGAFAGGIFEHAAEVGGNGEVEMVAVEYGVAPGDDGEFEATGIAVVFGDEIGGGARRLGDGGDELGIVAAALFGGHFGVDFVEGFEGGATGVDDFAHRQFAVGCNIDFEAGGFGVLLVGGHFDGADLAGGEVEVGAMVVERGAEFGILRRAFEVEGFLSGFEFEQHGIEGVARGYGEQGLGGFGEERNSAGEDEFGFKPSGLEQGVEDDHAVGVVAIALFEGLVGGGDGGEWQVGERGAGWTQVFVGPVAQGDDFLGVGGEACGELLG